MEDNLLMSKLLRRLGTPKSPHSDEDAEYPIDPTIPPFRELVPKRYSLGAKER